MAQEKQTSSPDIKPERLEAFRTHILKRFGIMKQYRDPIDTDVVKWIKLYNMVKDKPKYDWQSNLFVPYTYIVINTILPRLRAALFGNGLDQVSCESYSEAFFNFEKIMGQWFNAKLRRMKFKRKGRAGILEALKYPHAILKARWEYVNNGGKEISEPEMDLVPYFDFWWDPNGTTMENCKDVIHRVVRDYSYLQAMGKVGRYKNVEDCKDTQPHTDITEIKQDIGQYGQVDRAKNDEGFHEVELLEYWGRFDLDGDGVDEEVMGVIANREILVRWGKNPIGAKPFGKLVPLEEDNQFTGMPMIKLLMNPQHELNTVRNQRVDNRNLILRKSWILDPDTDLEDPDSVFNGPGHVIKAPLDAIKEMDTKDVTQNAVIEEGNIKTDMNEAGAVSDYWINSRAKSNDTRGGIQMLMSEAASRFQDMVLNLAEQFQDFFQIILLYCKEYRDTSDSIRTEDEAGKAAFQKIPVEAIRGDYLFTMILKNLDQNPVEVQAQLVQVLNIAGKFPWINVKALVKAILEAFNIKNIKEIMNADGFALEQKRQLVAAMDAAAQQQQAGLPAPSPQQVMQQAGLLGAPVDAAASGPAMLAGRPA